MKKYTLILALVIIVLIAGCFKSENGFLVSGKKLVKVQNDYITDDMINMFASGGYLTDEQKKMIMDELINNFLIYSEAMKNNIMSDTVFANQLELQRRLAIANKYIEKKLGEIPMPTEDEIQTYYQAHKKDFDKQVKIAMIFLGPNYTKTQADSIYDLLKRKRKSFKALAKEFAVDEASKKRGGVIDKYFGYKEWTAQGFPELDSIAFSLEKKGSISEPVALSNGGFAIVKIIDIIPSNKQYQDERNLIMQLLYQEKRMSYLQSYTEKLRQEANIEYYDQN